GLPVRLPTLSTRCASSSSRSGRAWTARDGLWFMDAAGLRRSLALMGQYLDHPMDLAHASLVAAPEAVPTRRVFTLGHDHFSTSPLRLGRGLQAFRIVPERS